MGPDIGFLVCFFGGLLVAPFQFGARRAQRSRDP